MKLAVTLLSLGLLSTVSVSMPSGDSPTLKRSFASSISFPVAGFYYSAGVWNKGFPRARGENAGCRNSGGDICGRATTNDGSIAKVEVSVKRGSGASARYWDGGAFNNRDETFVAANGTTHWNLNFGFDTFTPGIYTLHSRATDSAGQTEPGTIRIFSVSPDYTVIPVISSMQVIGKGNHPAFTKVPLTMDLRVFDKSDFQATDDEYGSIWERTSRKLESIPSSSQLMNSEDSESRDGDVRVQYGNSDAYLYEVMVPSNTAANRAAFGMSGSWVVIGKSMVCLNGSRSINAGSDGLCPANGGVATAVYTGANLNAVQAGSLVTEKHLNVAVDGNGRIHAMRSRPIDGTPMVISVPAYPDFTNYTELLPIVYESIGDGKAKVHIAPPAGFTVDVPRLETQGGSGDTDVVQFTLSGSWMGSTRTGLSQTITYQGTTIDLQMYLETDTRPKASRLTTR